MSSKNFENSQKVLKNFRKYLRGEGSFKKYLEISNKEISEKDLIDKETFRKFCLLEIVKYWKAFESFFEVVKGSCKISCQTFM